jgi:hypothetical protein
MDMSKLPRLSQSPAPPPPDVSQAPPGDADPGVAPGPPAGYALEPAGYGGDAWLSIAIGALLLLVFHRLIQYLAHVLFGTYFAPYEMDGTEVSYLSTLDFWSDLGISAFALVLIVEGLALAVSRRRAVVAGALALTVLATLYNLGYLVATLSHGVALMSALAVIFGLYIASQQWNLLKRTPPSRRDNQPLAA